MEKEESSDGIKLNRRSANGGMKMFGELPDRHENQEASAKETLPAVVDDFAGAGREDPREGVEKASLFGIGGVDHVCYNSLYLIML